MASQQAVMRNRALGTLGAVCQHRLPSPGHQTSAGPHGAFEESL